MASNEFSKKREYAIVTALNLIKNIWDKLKISLVLPKIFENPKLLHKYLKGSTYEEDCLKMIMDYRHKMEREPLSPSLRLKYDLIGIIDYFHANQEILEVLPDWFGDIDSDEKTIMNSFQGLFKLAEDRFNRLGLKHLNEEKHLHDIYLANEQIKKDINDLSRQMQHRKIHDQWKFAIHTGLIKSLENRLAEFQLENETRIKDGISQSYREISRLNVKYDTIQKELEDHLKSVLKDLKKEKKLRDEKNKYQYQLQSTIQKYDQTMVEKYKEEMQVNDYCEKLQNEFEDFMIEYKREYALYDELVVQKQKFYREQHDAEIRMFRENVAARRLQKWWKKSHKKSKEKLKKIKPINSKKRNVNEKISKKQTTTSSEGKHR